MSQIVYGRNAVLELMKSRPDDVAKVYFQFNTDDKKLTDILITAKRNQIAIGKASNQKLAEIANTPKHQGVVALTSDIKFRDLDEILGAPDSKPFFFVVLDSIEDPQNMGAIIRTAECAGATAVLIPKDGSAPINSTVHKTSAGAVSHATLCRVGNLAETLRRLKENNIWVVGTDSDGRKNYTEFDYTMNVAVVIGSEGKGMRRLVKETCDEVVRLPMFGKTESLNASVSAGVMLYEVVRQRQLNLKSNS